MPSDTSRGGIQILLNINAGIFQGHICHRPRDSRRSPRVPPELQKCCVCKATHVRLARGSLQKYPEAVETRESPLSLQLAPCFLQVRGRPPGRGVGARMSHCKRGMRGHRAWRVLVTARNQPGNRVSSLEIKPHNVEQFCSATRAGNRAFVCEISQNMARNTLNLLPYPES